MKNRIAILLVVILTAGMAVADEGMWLYNAPPSKQLKSKYGFNATQQWLDHVRLGSVRFNNGGSGSFVSPTGLTFTNHHVGRVCMQDLSTKEKDYIKDGFYAKTQAEEGKCPGLELNVLMSIDDVTARIQNAAPAGASAAEAGTAQRQMISQVENECNQKTGLRCDVVTLYSGGQYHLYRYKKYTDVRLVFAPEASIAFFGGDPDNFEYPRYDLDITFFRVYENNKPVELGNNYLKFAKQGVKEGDLVFVSGNPGGTDRMLTMSQLHFMRDTQIPFALENLSRREALLKKFSAESAENARIAGDEMFGVQNSLKVYRGRREGLADPTLMKKKQAEETTIRKQVESSPVLSRQYGDAWENISSAMDARKKLFLSYNFIEGNSGFASDLARYAKGLVRVAAEKKKPSNLRLREYSDARLPTFEQQITSTAPIYKELEEVTLADSLKFMQEKLGADNPTVKKVLSGKSPDEVAKEAISNTKLGDPAVRKQLYDGGEAAIEASTDPLIVMMRNIDPDARAVRKQYEDQVDSPVRQNTTKVAKARFAAFGSNIYPDATFTLRLAYGTVKGYEQGGKQIPWFTTMGGAYDHAAAHDNKDPYELPASWTKAKAQLDLKTPLDFVSTADIIGGNSGSPTLNRDGEVVGIVFDMNMPSLVWDFAYDDRQGRCVHTDERSIIESLRKVYHADALADELEGTKK